MEIRAPYGIMIGQLHTEMSSNQQMTLISNIALGLAVMAASIGLSCPGKWQSTRLKETSSV